MPWLTQQKVDLRDIIHKKVMEKYRATTPERQSLIAEGLTQRLTARMTVKELRDWLLKLNTGMFVRGSEEARTMRPTNVNRYGCVLGRRTLTWQQVQERYVCDACGGLPVHRLTWDDEQKTTVDVVRCADCGGDDFIDGYDYWRQLQLVGTTGEEVRARWKKKWASLKQT